MMPRRASSLRHHLRQRDDAGLGRGVVGLAVEADDAGDRGDVDDPPAVAHDLGAQLGAVEDAVEVGLR